MNNNTPSNMTSAAATPIQYTTASSLSPTPSKRKTPKWTDEEDQKLFQLVNTPSNGKKSSWSTIASQMPHHTRTAKQCRERYVNNLNPDRKKSAWTAEEDETVMKLQAKLGTQWTKIADLMPGRTDNDVKNRWYTKNNSIQKKLMKNKRKAANGTPNNNSTSKSNGGKSIVPNITKKAKLTTTTTPQHHPTPPVNIGTNVAKGTDNPPKIGMRVQVKYGGIAHGGVIKYVTASSNNTFFDLKIQYDNGEVGDNVYPGPYVKLIPTKSNLSSSEVALCHELVGLQNTLKVPRKTEEQGMTSQSSEDDNGDKVETKKTPFEPPKRTAGINTATVSAAADSLNMDTAEEGEKKEEVDYDDYLFEYLAIKERGGFDSVPEEAEVVESEVIDVDEDTSDEDVEKSSNDEYSFASSLANRDTDAIDLLCGKVFDSMKHQKAKASATSSIGVTGLNILSNLEKSRKTGRHMKEDDDDSSYRPTPRTRKPSAKLKSTSSFTSLDGRPAGGTYYRSRNSSSSGKPVAVGNKSWPMFDILTPGPHDVLVGRGGHTNHHPGNIKWRNIVEDLKPEYKASERLEKSEIAMRVVRQWRALDPPGRFLKRDEDTELWYDIGDADARIKCSQVLRELKEVKLHLNSEKGGQLDANNEEVSVSGNYYDLEPHRYLQASSPSETDSASRYSPDFYSQGNNAYARSSSRKRVATFKASIHDETFHGQNAPTTLSLPKKTKAKTVKKALKKAVKKATSQSKKKVGPQLPTRKAKKKTPATGAGTVVTHLDVISGRGGGSNNHPGNLRFRDEARKLRGLYESLDRVEKKAVSLELVQRVKDYGGRFLKQGSDKIWYDISNTNDARKKCSQVLRENKWE